MGEGSVPQSSAGVGFMSSGEGSATSSKKSAGKSSGAGCSGWSGWSGCSDILPDLLSRSLRCCAGQGVKGIASGEAWLRPTDQISGGRCVLNSARGQSALFRPASSSRIRLHHEPWSRHRCRSWDSARCRQARDCRRPQGDG